MVIGDRYSILAPLARGGFGTVYEAEQITTERRVALKLVARQPGLDSTEYLLGEARLASRLQSDHIVQVIDAGIDHASGSVFVVMDLLAGSTLADVLEQRGRFDAATTVEYVRQLCTGLEKAHTHVDRDGNLAPIVHRDLKPANVFVTRRDNGAPLLKILDFGTAKLLSSSAISSRIVRGTPQYMAPEQLAGERPTPATDIWSLGLMTFEMLTGRSYWLAVLRDAPYEALFNEMHALPFVRASQRAREVGENLDLGPGFDEWFAHCVQRHPAQRFASASLAADELARALSGVSAPHTAPLADGGAPGTAPGTVFVRGAPATPALPAQPPRPRSAFDATTSATWVPRRPGRSRRLVTVALVAVAFAALATFALRQREEPAASAAEPLPPPSLTPAQAPAPPAPTPLAVTAQSPLSPVAAASTDAFTDASTTASKPASHGASPRTRERPVTSAPRSARPVKARAPRDTAEPAPKPGKDPKLDLYHVR